MNTYIIDFLDKDIPKAEETSEGFLSFMATVARIGNQEYLDANNKIKIVNRPEEEVASVESLATFANKPVTLLHPTDGLVTPNTAKTHQVGFTHSKAEYNRGFVQIGITLTDKEAIEAVKTGSLRQLSAGYTANVKDEKGEWEGSLYDAKQTDIHVNHIALVEVGRAGELCKVYMDSSSNNADISNILIATTQNLKNNDNISNNTFIKEKSDSATKIMSDDKITSTTVEKSTERVLDHDLVVANYKLQLDTANGKLAGLEATNKDLSNQINDLKSSTIPKTQLHEAVKTRVKLEKSAALVFGDELPNTITDLSDIEVMSQVIGKKYGTRINLENKSEDYIKAVFDTVMVNMSQNYYDAKDSNNSNKDIVITDSNTSNSSNSTHLVSNRFNFMDEDDQAIYKQAAERYRNNAIAPLAGNIANLSKL